MFAYFSVFEKPQFDIKFLKIYTKVQKGCSQSRFFIFSFFLPYFNIHVIALEVVIYFNEI